MRNFIRRWAWVVSVALIACSAAVAAEAPSAGRILKATGVQGGVIVHLGCGGGKLTAALRAGEGYVVHGLDADAANVSKARRHIRSLGLYGKVSVEQLIGGRLPYAENLVNLLVAEDLGAVPMGEVMRVLAPEGVAYVKKGSGWTKTVKPRPANIDEWTHFLHDAGNNAVAHDSVVGPPRRMQWVAKPLWLRSHETDSGIPAVVTSGGRVFYIFDEGLIGITDKRLPEKWSLIARDAFNGTMLWRRDLPQWGWRTWKPTMMDGKEDWTQISGQRTQFPSSTRRRLVAQGDRVFVTLGYHAPLSIVDAATGKTIRTIEGTEGTDEIAACDGVVVAYVKGDLAGDAARRGQAPVTRLVAIAGETGKVLWDKPVGSLATLSMGIRGGRIIYLAGGSLECRDLKTGRTLWDQSGKAGPAAPAGKQGKTDAAAGKAKQPPKKKKRPSGGGGTLVLHEDLVLVGGGTNLRAHSAETGKQLWAKSVPGSAGAARADLFVADGLAWVGYSGIGYDLKTGEIKRQVSTKNLRSVGHHHRCYRGKATDKYIMVAQEGIEFIDLKGKANSRNNWVRGSCKHGIMPANGLLYVPADQCFCEPGVKLLGFNALSHAADWKGPADTQPAARLQNGPAYGEISGGAARPGDWASYRHDGQRSGATTAVVPADAGKLWQVKLGGRVTQPVVAGGKLFVAAVDAHTLHVMDSISGKALWSFTTGGRIDSPPTIHDGLVLMGSADGYVYCLRAVDGELAWRYRAAPEERRVGAFDQLESAWPVHGSVLVQNGLAYVCAGRSSFLDGGVFVCALEPKTGKVVHQARVEGPFPDFEESPGQCFWVAGSRAEVLVGDGESVFMRNVWFDGKLKQKDAPVLTNKGDQKIGLHLSSTSSLLDDEWYNRSFWTYWARFPGFYHANQAPQAGQLIVFDDERTFAVKVFYRRNRHSPMFFPGKEGYLLFADAADNEPILYDGQTPPKPIEWLPQSGYASSRGGTKIDVKAEGFDKGMGFTRAKPPLWAEWIPVRIRAMVKAGPTLFVAGPPDIFDEADPLAAFENRKGGRLLAVSASDGKKLAELKLDSEPVLDGLIAAEGRLYLATKDGRIVCLGRK